jgi:spore coat protein U-like protein
MNLPSRVLLGTTMALLAPASSVLAATATTTMPVTATVLKFCTVVATPMAFGNYTGSEVNSTATITTTCTAGTSFDIAGAAPTASTVYGKIPATQAGVSPDAYSDLINVTITY